MFNNVTWANYVSIVALLLIVYYLFIGIKFYSLELQNFLSSKSKLPIRSAPSKVHKQEDEKPNTQVQIIQPELFPSSIEHAPSLEEKDDTFQQVEELSARLKEIIEQAADKNYIKEEFILSLQLELKKYQFLKGSPFRTPVNNLIASECEKYGYIPLSAEERVMLWNE